MKKEPHPKEFLSDVAVSDLYSIPVQTLRNWRHNNRGPAYVKFGRLCRYQKSILDAYVAANTIETEDCSPNET